MQDLKTQENKQKVAKLMATGYSIPESDALGMLGDAHSTNYAENRDFFLNQNNPTNFERTWNTAYFLYKKINAVTAADAVRPGDGLLHHPEAGRRSRSTPARRTSTTSSSRRPAPASIQGEKDEILTKTVVIHFFPNSWDLNKKVTQDDRRQGRRGALRSERRLRRRGGRQAGRPVRRRADRDRRTHRRIDEAARCRRAWCRSCR